MYFFAFMLAVLFVGLALHVALDRSPARRTAPRVLELVALWFVVWGIGVNGVLAGLVHTGPGAASAAAEIGFLPTPFQWEVGVNDLAVGIAGVLCARRSLRGGWMSATVAVAFVSLWGDAIGHVMQLVAHDDTAVNNVWAMPIGFGVPLVAAIALVASRRSARAAAAASTPDREPAGRHAHVPA